MEKRKYFVLKNYEYIFFYVFIFIGMSLHFIFTEGNITLVASNANLYVTYSLVIFGCYGYFAVKAKNYRHKYLQEKNVDVYLDDQRVFSIFHRFTPFIMMTLLGFLEFNFLQLPYYPWFYFLLSLLSLILFYNIYFSNKVNKNYTNRIKEERKI